MSSTTDQLVSLICRSNGDCRRFRFTRQLNRKYSWAGSRIILPAAQLYTEISAGRCDRMTVHDRKIVLKAHAHFAISCQDVRRTTNGGTDDVVSSNISSSGSSLIMQVDHDGGDLIDLLTRPLIIS